MKKILFFSIALIIFLPAFIYGQIELPRLSQKASVMQKVGHTEITITYSRPNVKERTIWGDLVPYGHVWRTGADEATNISFSDDVEISGRKIPAGKYALFSIPGKDNWTIIINSVAKQWGAFNYDSTKDVYRFQVTPKENQFVESMLFYFSDVAINTVNINLEWEKIKVSFPVTIDFDTRSYKNITEALASAKPDDWVLYAIAANYAADYDLHLDEGLEWINKSISIKESFYNYYLKARLESKLGNIADAVKSLNKSKELGKNDKDYQSYIPSIHKLESELETKK